MAPVVLRRQLHRVIDLAVLQQRHSDPGGAVGLVPGVVPDLEHPAHGDLAVQVPVLGPGGDVILPVAAGDGPGRLVRLRFPVGQADGEGGGLDGLPRALRVLVGVSVHQVQPHRQIGEDGNALPVGHAGAAGRQGVQEHIAPQSLSQIPPLGAGHVVKTDVIAGEIPRQGEADIGGYVRHAVDAHGYAGCADIHTERAEPVQIVNDGKGVRL